MRLKASTVVKKAPPPEFRTPRARPGAPMMMKISSSLGFLSSDDGAQSLGIGENFIIDGDRELHA
jgi:hypothetical protein